MSDTAMGAAFERAGYKPNREKELWRLAVEMLRWGSLAECHRLIDQASADMDLNLPGKGHDPHEIRGKLAQSRQGEEGRLDIEIRTTSASSPPPRDGTGRGNFETQSSRARPVANEPTPVERLAALKTRTESLSIGWLANYRIPGKGPTLLQMRVCDIRGMAHRMAREGGERIHAAVVIAALEQELNGVNEKALIGEALAPQTIKRIEQELAIERLKPSAVEWLKSFPKLQEIIHAQ